MSRAPDATDAHPTRVLLQADDLVAGYVPEVNILNGCSLELYPAELVGIIGPNGAGKSTLLKALFGLIPVRSGEVTLRGERINVAEGPRAGPQGRRLRPADRATCSAR